MSLVLAQAQAQIKAVYEDGEAEINGNTYKFGTFIHAERRKVLSVAPTKEGDISFLGSTAFDEVEQLIMRKITLDGVQLSKMGGWQETHAADYMPLIMTAMGVITYPFMAGAHTS